METIKKGRDFQHVFSQGKRGYARLVRITYLKDEESKGGTIAFVAAKRFGGAVYRNRCKRLLREAARMSGFPIPGWSVILFSTARTYNSSPREISRDLIKLKEVCRLT